MKILALDCDSFAYRADYRVDGSWPEVTGDRGGAFEDRLVLLVSVEPGDATMVGTTCKAIRRLLGRLGTTTLVINGFAHLSAVLEAPEKSQRVLRDIADQLRELVSTVIETPFGWHKRFDISVRSSDNAQKFLHFENR